MSMFTQKNAGRDRSLAEINVTPLCDVLLVLLIIFMVTTPLLTQGIDVNLPQAKAQEVQRTKDDVILTMHQTGGANYQIFVGDDKTPISTENLEHHLKVTFEEREQKDIFLRADREILYGDVAKVMAIAKLAGVQRIGMMTQPEAK